MIVRAFDMETRLGLQRPPLLAWLGEAYPELFGAADLHRRLWLYAEWPMRICCQR